MNSVHATQFSEGCLEIVKIQTQERGISLQQNILSELERVCFNAGDVYVKCTYKGGEKKHVLLNLSPLWNQ